MFKQQPLYQGGPVCSSNLHVLHGLASPDAHQVIEVRAQRPHLMNAPTAWFTWRLVRAPVLGQLLCCSMNYDVGAYCRHRQCLEACFVPAGLQTGPPTPSALMVEHATTL